MSTTVTCSSPLSWVGGKYYAAGRIVSAFPPAQQYGTYVEVFGGAAHVLMHKPKAAHLEVYNDGNGDLVNFWMQARDHAQALQERIETLPFSRLLYQQYREQLKARDAESLEGGLERAAQWFYVIRSTFGGVPDLSKGWGYSIQQGRSKASSLRTATALLALVAARFRLVQIECQDFETLITAYQTPRTLFYCDPPYIGCEDYYHTTHGASLFSADDHARLASLLNATPALVAVSYYEHPLLEELYPASVWRRMTWTQPKAVERTTGSRQQGREVLLMNYPQTWGGLWQQHESEAESEEDNI